MKARLLSAVAVAVVVGTALSGCSDTPSTNEGEAASAEMRTDIEPLAGRLPALGSDFTAQWFSNTTFDQRASGPSSFWINALVTPANGVEHLIDGGSLTPSTPDVRDQLAEILPECEWESSTDIDRAWGPLDWDTNVWFCQERDQLVITMAGGA